MRCVSLLLAVVAMSALSACTGGAMVTKQEYAPRAAAPPVATPQTAARSERAPARNGIYFLNLSGGWVTLYLDERLTCELDPETSCVVSFSGGNHVVRVGRASAGSQTLNVNERTPEHVLVRAGYFEDAFSKSRLY